MLVWDMAPMVPVTERGPGSPRRQPKHRPRSTGAPSARRRHQGAATVASRCGSAPHYQPGPPARRPCHCRVARRPGRWQGCVARIQPALTRCHTDRRLGADNIPRGTIQTEQRLSQTAAGPSHEIQNAVGCCLAQFNCMNEAQARTNLFPSVFILSHTN